MMGSEGISFVLEVWHTQADLLYFETMNAKQLTAFKSRHYFGNGRVFICVTIINSSILLKTKFNQSGSLETMKLISFQ